MDILKAGDGVTSEEAHVLGSFKWNKNEAVLHSDVQVNRIPEYDRALLIRMYLAHAEGRVGLVKLELPERVRDRSLWKVSPKHQPSLLVRGKPSVQKC